MKNTKSPTKFFALFAETPDGTTTTLVGAKGLTAHLVQVAASMPEIEAARKARKNPGDKVVVFRDTKAKNRGNGGNQGGGSGEDSPESGTQLAGQG